MGRGLSEPQEDAIRQLGRAQHRAADAGESPDEGVRRLRSPTRTPSGRASWARTLRRLEGRGLIFRAGSRAGLTVQGWYAFARLTGEPRMLTSWFGIPRIGHREPD
jgi:hypothetical protein